MKTPQDLTIGDAIYYPREQALGIIYETYSRGDNERPGVQVLLSNGEDLSGFSPQEADQFLQPLGPTGLTYQFQNVTQLARDYERGVFGQAFHNAQVLQLTQSLNPPE
ncbi:MULTISPECIES: hypothetical protein [Hymenobacter]|uniref:Uncharacterized protein n=1 Tax=Hymenobacter mucosus TaxID=1411120 RepID=A0A239BB11_9BACT|nr:MULTISPECIES: hypothetical protein [Hymenobacter]MDF7815584.1 hypothetical protein [Hymenobacter sp. YC55]SNS04638.1 hypothetical protein SAMN06269173_12022 [Hymenobacter mucosus]